MKSNPTVRRGPGQRSAANWLLAGLLAMVASFAGCGGGGGGVGGSSISDFTNTFRGFDPNAGFDAATAERVDLTLFPDSASENKPSGSFDATSSNIGLYNGATMSSTSVNVGGTFNGTTFVIELTSPLAPLPSTFSGHFSDNDTIVLTGGGTTLTLRRSGGSFTADVVASTWAGTDAAGATWDVQLDVAPGFDETLQTFLIEGSETLSGVTSQITGYISVRYIEFHITRASGTVVLAGEFPISSGTVNGNLMMFDAGGSLTRTSPVAPARLVR